MDSKQFLDQLLDHSAALFGKVNPTELCSNLEKLTDRRPGLALSTFNYLRSFGPDINHIIEPSSSDEATEPETGPPSLKVVVDSLLDCNMACITVSLHLGHVQAQRFPAACLDLHSSGHVCHSIKSH